MYFHIMTVISGILSLSTFIATHSIQETLKVFIIAETIFILVIILIKLLDSLSSIDLNKALIAVIGYLTIATATSSVVAFLAFILDMISHYPVIRTIHNTEHVFVITEGSILIGAVLGTLLGIAIDRIM